MKTIYYSLSPLLQPGQICWLPNPAALAGVDMVCHPDALDKAQASAKGYTLRPMDAAEEQRRQAARHDVIVEV